VLGLAKDGNAASKEKYDFEGKNFAEVAHQEMPPSGQIAAASVMGASAIAGLLILGGFVKMMYGRNAKTYEKRHALMCWYEFSHQSMFTILIPVSYDLALALNRGAVYSGFLIGTCKLGTCLGSIVPWAYIRWNPEFWRTKSQSFIVCGLLLELLGASVFAVLSIMVAFNREDPGYQSNFAWQTIVLVIARLVHGIGSGIISNSARQQCIHAIPAEEFPAKMLIRNMTCALATGMGPAFASLALMIALGTSGKHFPSFAFVPLVMVVFPIIGFFGLLMVDPIDKETDQCPSARDSPQVSESEVHSRKNVVIAGLLFMGISCLGVSALEAATALLLEESFGWSVQDIGVAIACCFATCPLTYMDWRQLPSDLLSMSQEARCFMTMMMLGSLLLAVHSPYILLVADCVLFAGLMMSGGLVEGALRQHCLQSTWLLDINNITLALYILMDGLGRFSGPPIARWLIAIDGQVLYAQGQLVMSASTWVVLEWLLRHATSTDAIKDPSKEDSPI
jgi:hypothetical protein